MTEGLLRVSSPEGEELARKRTELSALSESLADKELELEELKLSLSRFEYRYFHEIGRKYVQLDEILAQVAESEAKRNPQDNSARARAHSARAKAQETAVEFNGFEETEDMSPVGAKSSKEVNKLYRKIASLIHPDRTTDESSRKVRTRLMAELNQAYAQGNPDRMREILSEWQNSPESVTGEGAGPDLVRVIRTIAQLRRRISAVENEIERAKNSDMYRLMIQVHEADSCGRDLLNEMATAVQVQIDQASQRLAELL
jgi:hypothetical protein